MRQWILLVAVTAVGACGGMLWQQYFRAKAAQAQIDEAMRPFNELRAKHEQELAEFKAQQQARLEQQAKRDKAAVDALDARLSAAQALYDRDAEIYGKEEAARRHQAGVYLRAVLEGK
jgi:Skp family chaperone for outer membrane proteins